MLTMLALVQKERPAMLMILALFVKCSAANNADDGAVVCETGGQK